MSVVALAGRRKSGKSTAADIICSLGEEMHIYIRRVSFSEAIREMYCEERGIGMRMLIDPETKEDFRQSVIDFASVKRAANPRIFINALFSQVSVLENIIIDDLRTIEELEAVKTVGGVPYKIHASMSVREARGYKYNPSIDNHYLESEMDLSGDTFRCLGGGQIFNTGSQAYLKNQLFDLVCKEYKSAVLV